MLRFVLSSSTRGYFSSESFQLNSGIKRCFYMIDWLYNFVVLAFPFLLCFFELLVSVDLKWGPFAYSKNFVYAYWELGHMIRLVYLFIADTILKKAIFSKQISSDNVELGLVILEQWRLKRFPRLLVFLERSDLEETSLPHDIDKTHGCLLLYWWQARHRTTGFPVLPPKWLAERLAPLIRQNKTLVNRLGLNLSAVGSLNINTPSAWTTYSLP